MSDEVLAEGATAEVGFAEFFAAHHVRLGRSIYLLVGDRLEAEDLVQEALGRAYERWDRVSRMSDPVAYVYRIAANLHKRRMRRRKHERTLANVDERPGDEGHQVDQREDVLAALRTLSRGEREAIILVEYLGYVPDAAAKILGVAAATIRVRVHRGHMKLRVRLGGPDE